MKKKIVKAERRGESKKKTGNRKWKNEKQTRIRGKNMN